MKYDQFFQNKDYIHLNGCFKGSNKYLEVRNGIPKIVNERQSMGVPMLDNKIRAKVLSYINKFRK